MKCQSGIKILLIGNRKKKQKNDLVIFDYSATVEGKKFEGSDGKNIRLEIGRELFLKGFDDQLVGLKQKDEKTIKCFPPNFPNKSLLINRQNLSVKL